MTPISFLVVDDHPIFRQGLVALIQSQEQYNVRCEAGSIPEALEKLNSYVPEIALIDISLQNQSGLDLVRQIRQSYPSVKILIISMHDEVVYASRALKAGAMGYVMKQEPASLILEAVQTVLNGKIYVSSVMRDRLLEMVFLHRDENEAVSTDVLSDRELEVLDLMGQGYGAVDIAKLLTLSVKTVNAHYDHIKDKLKMTSTSELRRYAVKWIQHRDR